MADGVVIIGAETLGRRLTRLARGIATSDVLGEIGAYLVASITTRTQHHHEDVDERPFVAYSPKYLFFRQKSGYGTQVDLTLTGGMFAALTHEIFTDRVKVFFGPGTSRGTDVQHPAKAFYLQEKRKFFGFTDQDVANIMELYSVNIEGELRGR